MPNDEMATFVLKLEILRREIDIGLAQAERGEFWERSIAEIANEVLAKQVNTDCRSIATR